MNPTTGSPTRATEDDEEYAGDKCDDELSQLADKDQYSDRSDSPLQTAKRHRTSNAKTQAPRKKHVRGRQGGLQCIMKMPLEIFTEIACYITPGDLISLIRTSKLFRVMLLQRSALPLWQRSLNNVSRLPPCPTGMSEPQYAALMFSKFCTLCGAHAPANPDAWLRARFCPKCRDTELVQVPHTLINYVSQSDDVKSKIKKLPGSSGVTRFCLREDLERVAQQRAEFLQAGDTEGLRAWGEEAKKSLEIQRKEGGDIWHYFYLTALDRSNELNEIKSERRDNIHLRLKELGWEEKELEFHDEYAKPWKALVDVPKPLTEKIWTSILPKLTPLLEANRARVQEAERRERQIERCNKLNGLLRDVKRETYPYHDILDALGITIPDESNIFPAPLDLPNPFPESAVAMEWDFIKDIYEQDVSVERVEELFSERRAQLEQKVLEWRSEAEAKLVERHGTVFKGEDDPIVTVQGKTDLTPALYRNTRFLLRADTVFRREVEIPVVQARRYHTFPSSAYYYPNIASFKERDEPQLWGHYTTDSRATEFSSDNYHRHIEMEKVVKSLLKEMGMPDVAFIELQSMNQVFSCGRCEMREPVSWRDLTWHYLYHIKKWTDDEASRPFQMIRHPIVCRNVHALDSTSNPKPLVRIWSTEEAKAIIAANSELPIYGPGDVTCVLCSMLNYHRWCNYRTSPDRMRVHLRDVHEIMKPIEGVHYKPSGDLRATPTQMAKWRKQWDELNDAQLAKGGVGPSLAV